MVLPSKNWLNYLSMLTAPKPQTLYGHTRQTCWSSLPTAKNRRLRFACRPEDCGGIFDVDLAQGFKSSTIRRKVSSISAIHRLSSLEDPTKHSDVRIIQRKIYRQLGTRFDQAYPITSALLTRLLAACKDDLHGLRDRALLMVAYDSMRRRSELISLRVEDIEWIPDDGASILLRKSKTDQQGCGKWIHLTSETSHALHQWLAAAKINKGLIFRGVRSTGAITDSLCETRIPRIYKTLARKAGFGESVVQNISGHSMRVGGAQDLLNVGASLPQLMTKGGWSKTDTVMRYIEKVRPYLENCFETNSHQDYG